MKQLYRHLPNPLPPLGGATPSVHPGGDTGYSMTMPRPWSGGPFTQRCAPLICNGIRSKERLSLTPDSVDLIRRCLEVP